MDTDWNTEVEVELPLPSHRKSIGLENGVMELLWHNGEVVFNNKKSSCQCHGDDVDEETATATATASWIHCPIDDEAFQKEFCFSDELIAPPNPITSLPAPPTLIIPSFNHSEKGPGEGGSCGSNQVEKTHGPRGRFRLMQEKKIIINSTTTSYTELQPITTSSTNDDHTSTRPHKRKSRDHQMEDDQSECQSDAPESELTTGNKVLSSQKSRRSRVAEVHNLSERRRRDRINEKMKALQELIPHSNKQSDKASMLDEAIEYMKSLQLQLQLMWNMGSTGMAAAPPMMHQYLYHPAVLVLMQQYMMSSPMAPTPTPTLPQIQNHLMRFLSHPNINNNNNQPTQNHHPSTSTSTMFNHQMQNPNFTDHQYANNNYINTFHPMQNTSTSTSQPVNMFDLGAQQNHHDHVLAQPNINGNNGST